ncbi:uncharacterized protein LOC5506822 isoform X2 [Nematostella vectensis]|uniref:uncharacterized protein LOC5506822 isoform X2 n=1 Tax=Nematostella vectensis TaxID=45351 RepID=UPI0020776832|nr:uncharacterized protein LOC5506822 isoform X2 [Nematostella vectensis]
MGAPQTHRLIHLIVKQNLKVMDFRDSMTRLESSLKEWIQVRKETVNKLENIGLANMIEKLKNVIKTENQANSVGTGMSVAGGAVMFGAVVASFFVGGAAVQAVQLARQSGKIVKDAGKATCAFAKIYKHRNEALAVSTVEEVIREDRLKTASLRQALDGFSEQVLKCAND